MGIALILSAASATLPMAIRAAPGDLYVTNLASNTVDIYAPDGTKSVFASELNSPQGLVFDRTNNLYVADGGSGSIFKYDTAGTRTTFYTGLSSPVGMTITGNRLMVVESGKNQSVALVLDQSGAPRTVFSGREGMVDVKVKRDLYFVTWDTQIEFDRLAIGWEIFLDASPRGMAIIPSIRGTRQYDAYVTTAGGKIWVTAGAGGSHPRTVTFASGLTDPWGMAFAPRQFSGDDDWQLFVADRATGEIYKYNPSADQSLFVSDAGIPNFLVFETE
jgi:DNA-binding beta-propeller fold protein YncE